jgi:tetratricopeptide (TPR) repeat protein
MLKLNLMRNLFIFLFLIFPLFFSQAANLVKDDAIAYRDEGYRLQALGDLKTALVYYQKAVQMDPHFAEAYNDIGVVYESLGDDESAVDMYKKVLSIDPGYLPAYTNLAFAYERKGDVENATFYWTKRYEAGQEGDYWWEVSRQHLLKLGTYPQVRKEIMERKAAKLSQEVIYRNEQRRFQLLEEAESHFVIGNQAFIAGDYEVAIEELRTVLYLNPPDEGLKSRAREIYEEAERLYLRAQAFVNSKSALDYIDKGDYLSAQEKLKCALAAVSSITQKD